MGTRAQFFVGNPENVDSREWLGCVAWDGYPSGDIGRAFARVKTEYGFRKAIARIQKKREDFCDPAKHGFPFPWVNDLFLTDYTYAWFNDCIMMTCYHRGWIPLNALNDAKIREDYYEKGDNLSNKVPSPSETWDRSGPDSIMILSA